MTGLLKSSSDWALWLKSVLIVCAVAALLLGGMRHKAPATSPESSVGGHVVLLPLKENSGEDRKAFERWKKLNLPSGIFGYASSGPFTALLTRESREAAPPEFSSRPVFAFTPLLTLPEYPVLRMEPASVSSEVPLPPLSGPGTEKLPLTVGAVVYDGAGKVRLLLPGLRGGTLRGPLMLRAEKALVGTEFRVVGSSGSDEFDRGALKELEQRVRQGESFSGILTVWGDGRRTK